MLSTFFCSKPFTDTEIHLNGDVFVCCPSWLPKPIGNINKQSWEEVWNSPMAQDIRASMHDGTFRHCDAKGCPFLSTRITPRPIIEDAKLADIQHTKAVTLSHRPLSVLLANDLSCNLSCPSCRTDKINFTVGTSELNQSLDLNQRLIDYFLHPHDPTPLTINITGSGDPFASIAYKTLLETIDGSQHPELKIELQTNGVLLSQKNWERLQKIHSNITRIFVSIDAVTEETYRVVRRGGHWPILMENLAFLKTLRRQGSIRYLQANFVVQKENFKEMPRFVEMCGKFGFDTVYFSRINDWGCMTNYQEAAVFLPTNPLYPEFQKILTDPRLGHYRVNLGNLLWIREDALKIFRPPFNLKAFLHLHYNDLRRRKFYLPRKIQRMIQRFFPRF